MLAKKAVVAETLKAEAAAVAAEAKKVRDEVTAEMIRSHKKAIEVRTPDGLVRISLAEPESTVIHDDKILAAVRRKKDRRLLEDITYTETFVDQAKLLTAVQAGRIPMRVIERNTEIVPKTPYVTITVKGE